MCLNYILEFNKLFLISFDYILSFILIVKNIKKFNYKASPKKKLPYASLHPKAVDFAYKQYRFDRSNRHLAHFLSTMSLRVSLREPISSSFGLIHQRNPSTVVLAPVFPSYFIWTVLCDCTI